MRIPVLPLFVLLAGGCRPTSLLELDVFVSASALADATAPAALYVDFGPGHQPRAVSLCDWPENQFQEFTLEQEEFPPCTDTRTITGVLAPLTGGACNQGVVLPLFPPEDVDTWVEVGEVEAFATGACSIIESHTLVVGGEG
ncbi:MAG: hypothetical protein KC656_08160 [Myxococcales bacterium]|nr:hypothetical protein [Myxococcales bacterium]MCB9672030.1 hypothetical protein [Alphaproteobacteria bacterium]